MKGETAIPPEPFPRRVRSLEDLADDGDRLDPEARVHHACSLASERIGLPPLPVGATFLERWPVRERPAGLEWRTEAYASLAPATFILRDVLVHSSAGILAIGPHVMSETLYHTSPELHAYDVHSTGIMLPNRMVRHLPGTHVSVLAGAAANYFHATLDGVLRLAAVPPHLLREAETVLYPMAGVCHAAMLERMGLPDSLPPRPVADDETLLVDRLVFPVSVAGGALYHPCLRDMFDRISANVSGAKPELPRRLYLDRRAAQARPLLDEDEVADALRPLGFVSVRTESLALADQVRLFRQAEAIVAPHGAGLTNLGFCRPGCRVLELHMDAYVNWCFRPLAALCRLDYDCVLGRAAGEWPDQHDAAHHLPWRISAQHVVAAARRMLGKEAVLF